MCSIFAPLSSPYNEHRKHHLMYLSWDKKLVKFHIASFRIWKRKLTEMTLWLIFYFPFYLTEEEIDVVNISEKNLPTNPSARDRRALQTTVAHKIARSKQSNQRRRVSDDDSLSSSTSTLSSKGSTPIKVGSQTPQRYVFSSGHSSSRKRKDNNNNMLEISKKYRHAHSKKQRLSHSKLQKTIDPDEAETIEKRNLHNNMERQRRIGLKNLFEELKCQIPSLKDKERAPKVNILREAASYCSKLRRDEDIHAELMKKHNRLMTRVRNLKASIAAQQRRNY